MRLPPMACVMFLNFAKTISTHVLVSSKQENPSKIVALVRYQQTPNEFKGGHSPATFGQVEHNIFCPHNIL